MPGSARCATAYCLCSTWIVTDTVQKQNAFPRLGLLDYSETRWKTFVSRIQELNSAAAPGTSYKVLYLLRHGEGFRVLKCRKL
jgi:hypothetical protein